MRCYSAASVLSRIYFSRAAFVLISVVFDIRLCALLSDRLYIPRLRLYRGRCTHSPRIIQWNQSNTIFMRYLVKFLMMEHRHLGKGLVYKCTSTYH
jgi:hypothetical protein